MAVPIAAIIQGVGALSSSNTPQASQSRPMQETLLSKIGGGTTDAAATFNDIFGIASLIKDRKESRRRFNDQMALSRDQLNETKREFNINNVNDKFENSRKAGMTAIDLLAAQRAKAMQQFNDRTFKNAYSRG